MNAENILEFAKQKFIPLGATEPLSEEDCERISLYKRRFLAIKENFSDLIGDNTRISFSLDKASGRVTTQKSPYNVHRLKGLYLDYRVFQAQNEPTNFHEICKIIRNHFEDERVRSCVETELNQWNNDQMSAWHGYKFDKLVKIIFNAELFHTDAKKQAMLLEVYDNFTDDSLHTLLFFGVQSRLAQIRNINFIIGSCTFNHQYVRLPAT